MNAFSTARRLALSALGAALVSTGFVLPSEAQYIGTVRRQDTGVRGFFNRHPKVKAATVGAGVGTAAGAATGLISGRGTVRGAAIGAGTGAGVGLIRSSELLHRHPIVKDTATGAAVGLGLGLSSTRGKRKAATAAGVGAAAGLGLGVLKEALR